MQHSDEHEDSLPASLIRQYVFCPRIPFYNEVLNVHPVERVWQRQGIEFHQRESMLMKRRNLSQFGIAEPKLQHNVALQSQVLGIHGICDALLFNGSELSVLEFKVAGTTQPRRGHVLQLAAYALMAEETYQLSCTQLFILYGDKGKTHRIELASALRAETIKVIAKIKASFERPLLPASSATDAQCGQCEYLNFCADRND